MSQRRRLWRSPDAWAVAALVALWLLFYWRLFTPIRTDQASLKQGDFSGQFVAFAGYQYARVAAGELPLWNPYNNGGLPFAADTQSAAFYPPRLLTIALSAASGGWSYHALELEMTAHTLLFTLTLYLLVRQMTRSVFGGCAAALVGGYGGFLSGYPPLQLAILEAAAWSPLALLGVWRGVRSPARYGWVALAGWALGMSWLAGHPQTSYFLTLVLVAWALRRAWATDAPARSRLRTAVTSIAVMGVVAFGAAAVLLVPGVEYLSRTARAGFGYDEKANGFPIQDVIQFVYPGVVSLFSPLYIGVVGLALALIGVRGGRRAEATDDSGDAVFWAGVALVALAWSFGGNAMLYSLLYNVLPGLRFFRGQERAAYVVMLSGALLAGMGAAALARWDVLTQYGAAFRVRLWLNRLVWVSTGLLALLFAARLINPDAAGNAVNAAMLTTLTAGALLLIIPALMLRPQSGWLKGGLLAALVFELFTVSMDSDAVYDPVAPDTQLALTAPAVVQPVVADADTPFRVDGWRGLHDNYGSLYGVQDIRGISPLFLAGVRRIVGDEPINPRAWELLAVRYVWSDWTELPVPTEQVASGTDRYGAVTLHRLTRPRPFAHLIYAVEVVADEQAALARALDEAFNARDSIVLEHAPAQPPARALGANSQRAGTARVVAFAPEAFTVAVETPTDALLSLALPYYPGWTAAVDDVPTPILRAYGALTAVEVAAGTHTVTLRYEPLSLRVGAALSAGTWAALAAWGIIGVVRSAGVRQARA